MSMHASIGTGEKCGRGYQVEGDRRKTARVVPFPSTDAAGVSAMDLVGIDRVLRTFYAALSGAPDRRWHQFLALFERGSRVRIADGSEFPIEQYVQQVRDDEESRTVIEIDRAIRVDGALAFVASAYRAHDDSAAAVLGVNEFLLRKTEARWRIAGTTTDHRDAQDRRADAH
jgi:hypothetical protein